MRIHTKENLVLASLIGITGLIGLLLTLPTVSADTDTVDVITITVPSSCSISATGNNSHTAEISNGQTNSNVGESTIKAYCNDNNGFSIYAIGYTDNELGKTVLTSSTLGSTHDILTGTNTTGNSSWAMKLSTITSPTPTYPIIIAGSTNDTDKQQGDPDYTSFQEVPDDYTLVAKRKSSTDTGENAEGATLKTTYQVHISNTQTAGTYTGQVKYTMVHPYNTATPVTPFGLCENRNTCMQTQTSSSMATKLPSVGSTTTLYDSRDGQSYTVAKLADNKYWMVENLNIAGGTALSADDTDVTSAYIGSFSTSNFLTKTGSTIVLPASSVSGFDAYNYSYVYNTGNKTSNCADPGCYSYYSWDAATLGSGRSISTDNTDAPYSICPKGWKLPNTRTGTDSTSDFRGLMVGLGGSNSFASYYGSTAPTGVTMSTALQSSPSNFLLAGKYDEGSFYSGGSDGIYGIYWSSTSYLNNRHASMFFFTDSYVYSADYYTRNCGFSVRCLFSGN